MINPASFEVNGAYDYRAPKTYDDGSASTGDLTIYGTVEVTISGRTQRVRALQHRSDTASRLDGITAYGITGRYRTGMKAWPGSIELRVDGGEHVRFGFDSRSGRHHKATIFFA